MSHLYVKCPPAAACSGRRERKRAREKEEEQRQRQGQLCAAAVAVAAWRPREPLGPLTHDRLIPRAIFVDTSQDGRSEEDEQQKAGNRHGRRYLCHVLGRVLFAVGLVYVRL